MTTTTPTPTMATTTQPPQHWVRLDRESERADNATIDGYELSSARRALALLKARLGREALLALLPEDIAAGDEFLREQVRLSAGQELSGTTVLRARGISAADFGSWLARAFGREDVLLAAHPEHYSIHHAPDRDVNVVETLGEHVCSFFMKPWNASTPPVAGMADSTRRSRMLLGDGTVVGSVATAFHDTRDGLVGVLSVTLPATCQALVDQHLEHFAVEFRTWILQAAREQAATPDA